MKESKKHVYKENIHKPANISSMGKNFIARKASKTLSQKEKDDLLLHLHLNPKHALKCPQCGLPSLYYDSVTGWQAFSPKNHEMMLLLEEHIYCVKCDLGWENTSPEHTNEVISENLRQREEDKKTPILTPEAIAEMQLSNFLKEAEETAAKCPNCNMPCFTVDKVGFWVGKIFLFQHNPWFIPTFDDPNSHFFCIECGLSLTDRGVEQLKNLQKISTKAWICPKCNTNNDDAFCPECGEKKPEPEETTKICNCGKENDATTKFCPSCGVMIKQSQ